MESLEVANDVKDIQNSEAEQSSFGGDSQNEADAPNSRKDSSTANEGKNHDEFIDSDLAFHQENTNYPQLKPKSDSNVVKGVTRGVAIGVGAMSSSWIAGACVEGKDGVFCSLTKRKS